MRDAKKTATPKEKKESKVVNVHANARNERRDVISDPQRASLCILERSFDFL